MHCALSLLSQPASQSEMLFFESTIAMQPQLNSATWIIKTGVHATEAASPSLTDWGLLVLEPSRVDWMEAMHGMGWEHNGVGVGVVMALRL